MNCLWILLNYLNAFSHIVKIWWLYVYLNHYKNFFTFFFIIYKNEWKEHNFQWKKNQEKHLLQNKRIYSTDGIIVINKLVSEEEPYGNKTHLNTLLDTMIMMSLDHYA